MRRTPRRLRAAFPLVVITLSAAALGCGDSPDSPVAPATTPEAEATSATSLSFAQVNGGFFHTCGVATTGSAYCWGDNSSGQLGDGTDVSRSRPVAVAGGRPFTQVTAGDLHA
jgi:alpha-tubulin suppressor-like RCC1 family protein